jgi:hypothetical protein
MCLTLYERRLEPALEYVPEPVMELVEHVRVSTAQALHALGEVAARRTEEEVIVIVHEAIREAAPPAPEHLRLEEPQKQISVAIRQEDVVSGYAPVRDMGDGIGWDDAGLPSHLPTVRP